MNRRIGKLLLLQRCRDDPVDANDWENAGGSVEEGETLKSAIKREIFEETGLTEIKIGKPAYATLINKEAPCLIIVYLSETDGENIIISNEHQAFKWVDKDECRKAIRGGILYDFIKNDIFEMSWTDEE